uniref:Uncharacterized protein n=1 Tax=viral metagenome TaxID=1070528 RepID=A0A6C0IAT2_9ZZZZ
MEDGAISVYAEAKGEYTKQLCIFLSTPLQKFFLNLLETAKTEEPDKKKHLKAFQDLLSQIPDWNIDKVGRETTKIQDECTCDYLEELLTAVFIAHTKVLSAIRLTSKNKSIQITVPKIEHFIHRTLSESARRIWGSVYLFADGQSSLDRQKNLRQLEALLHECVQQAVRSLLPVKSLLRDYLAEPDENDEKEVAAAIKEEAAAAAEDAAPVVAPPVIEPVTIVEPVAPTIPTPASVPAVATPEPTVSTTEPTTPVPPQTIVVDTEQSVHFNDYDTVYSANNPNKTEIVYEPKNNDDDEDDVNDSIRILEEIQNLSTNDFEDLDAPPRAASPLQYEEL